MVKIQKNILDILCMPYGTKSSCLKFLGGSREESDGVVYKYNTEYGDRVLKIISIPHNKKENYTAFKERLEYAKFLVENGVNIVCPILNKKGKLYEVYCDNKNTYIAYSRIFVKGTSPVNIEDLNDKLIYEWGRITGSAHKAAKKIKAWKNISSFNYEYGFIDEINNFYNMCSNEYVKKKLIDVLKKMCSMPINRDTYGFIHNDNHANNILVNKGKITLIDFELSACQFFINDIVTPIERFMFNEWGGIHKPVTDIDSIRYFLQIFMKGYTKENNIDKIFIESINIFIDYRRLIIYIIMEKYLNKNTKLKNNFLKIIKEPPVIV